MFLVFARALDDRLASLAKAIETNVAANKGDRRSAFFVLLIDNNAENQEKVAAFADKRGVTLPMTIALEGSKGPGAYKLNPDDPLLLNNWGYLLAEHGVRLTEAKEMLERALEAEPENPYYLDSMGWIYYKMGDYRTALAYLLHAFQVKSDDPDICEHLGFTFRMLGDIKRATEFWKKALELDPSRKHLIKLLKQFEANL